jgi:tRNA-modifying protein YgfZ
MFTSMSSWFEFLQSRGARVDDARVQSFGDIGRELAAARDATILCDLSHNALIRATGDDAAPFLHGQLTNDVNALATDGAQWTGWCSAKGRLLASFLLIRRADHFLLLLPAEIAPAIQKRLSMYVLRSKVKIENVSEGIVRMALAGTKAPTLIAHRFEQAPAPMQVVEDPDGALAIGLEFGRFIVLAPAAKAPQYWQELAEGGAVQSGSDAWEWTSIRAGIPTVVAATQEAFVPQMANFDLIGAVSFRKGCYPGQEIVARTQYRGILKRRMALAHLAEAGNERPAAGESVYSSAFGEQAAGIIANAAPSPDGGYDALVVAQIEGLDRDDLRWKSPQGPALKVLSRPTPS